MQDPKALKAGELDRAQIERALESREAAKKAKHALAEEGREVASTKNAQSISEATPLATVEHTEFGLKGGFNKDEIQELLVEKLSELESQLSLLQKDNPDALSEVQILYINLNTIQEDFFNNLTPELTPQELKKAIDNFQTAYTLHVEEADKIMGHGWLYRVLEVVIKAVIGLFAGLGMVFGSVFGAGLVNEGHRAKFKNTFFKWNENDSSKALSQFKDRAAGTLSQLDAEDENPDSVKVTSST